MLARHRYKLLKRYESLLNVRITRHRTSPGAVKFVRTNMHPFDLQSTRVGLVRSNRSIHTFPAMYPHIHDSNVCPKLMKVAWYTSDIMETICFTKFVSL